MNGKVYIFVTQNITGIGGAQLYVVRKANYFASNGWTVLIVSYKKGCVRVPISPEVCNLVFPEMSYYPSEISNRVFKKVLGSFDDYRGREIVIESNNIVNCAWAECIAKHLDAKHFCYLLSENYPPRLQDVDRLLLFKFQQGQLFGITEHSIPNLFGLSGTLPRTSLFSTGGDGNIVEEYNDSNLPLLPESDWRILSLGRLGKDYVIPMSRAIAHFAQRNIDKRINVLYIGDTDNKEIKSSILSSYEGCENVNISLVGEYLPIPRQFFLMSDVAISSAGSADVCAREGLPTISVDGNDFYAIGLLGETTDNCLFRDQEPKIPIEELLEEVLVEKVYLPDRSKTDTVKFDYTKHLQVMEHLIKGEYYHLSMNSESKKERLTKLLISLLGFKAFSRCVKIKAKLLKGL